MEDARDGLLQIPMLRANAPRSVAGYARFRSVIDQDGALPARIKALYTAVTAAIRGYEAMARRELARAHRIGLDFRDASAAVGILSSVRGEGAALRFHEMLNDEYPRTPEDHVPMPEIEVGETEAKENFVAYFGTVPPSLAILLECSPVGADAYYLMREGTLADTALGRKFAELLLVAVLVADYSPWASVHIKGARTAGASEQEICEAIICAVPTSGLSAWVVGATAMEAGA
jgi:alkylhydroperoxidase/carboxymuconolactone decarboxylase family protein YurZ